MARTDRLFDTEDPNDSDLRSGFQRDRDRILYCSAFRRLGAVTQVVSASEGLIIHNRLTHSLKVAQVARRLAERLLSQSPPDVVEVVGGIDPDVVEAAALAHDLGHPPFGHIAEDELNTIDTNTKTDGYLVEGFEGNAQTFRIVARQAVRTYHYDGLNLTRATLNAIIKYPWFKGEGPPKKEKKWGAYREDRDAYEFAREGWAPRLKSAEAEIMDWADDIAYALHDTEDFYRAGLIPFELLVPAEDGGERRAFLRHVSDALDLKSETDRLRAAEDLKSAIGPLAPSQPFFGSKEQRCGLRAWISHRISAYLPALTLRAPTSDNPRTVKIDPKRERELAILKQLTWCYVIKNPALATQQEGQRRIIRELFRIFREAISRKRDEILPKVYAERVRDIRANTGLDGDEKERRHTRTVVDLIAAMTEDQALRLHNKLSGVSPGSALERHLHQSIGS